MATTRSQTNSEFESIALTDSSGLVIGLDVQQLAVSDVANLTIPGGTAGQLLSTDGNGALSWATAGGATVQVATQASETFTATQSQVTFTLARVASGTVAGSINGVTSAATAFTVVGSTVTYVQAENGSYPLKAGDRITLSYLYGTTSATQLGGLADVTITEPTTGEVLTYDTGSSSWINIAGPTAFGELVNGTSNVAVETDGAVTVNIDGAANVAIFAATGVTIPGNLSLTGANVSLGDVANVTITGGTAGQALVSLGGGDVAFQNATRLVLQAYSTGAYVFPAAYVSVPIKYDTKVYDPQLIYDTATGRFQPKIAGWYEMTAGADIYCGATNEASLGIVHSVTGGVAQISAFGVICGYAVGIAYFNGTTDYAYVTGACQVAGNRTQIRPRSTFTATYLGL